MGKQGKEDQQNESKETTETFSKKKDIIITVYVESPPPPIHVHQKGSTRDTCKKSKPFSKSTGGYDRRAQLLAYAKEPRNGDREQPQWPKNIPKPKHKKGGKSLKYSGENPRHHKKPKEILAISAGRGHSMQTKFHY